MSSSEELAKLLEATLAAVEQAKEALQPAKEEQGAILKEKMTIEQEYYAKIAALNNKRKEIDERVFQAQSVVNDADRKMKQIMRDIEIAKEKERQEELRKERELENATLTDKWDRLTAAAPWREWAKDHQIAAAHKIVMDRKVILADPMGLGKTLSAIITCDMAERATARTSETWPFLGEEKEVYVPAYYVNPMTDEKANYPFDGSIQVPAGYQTKIVNAITRPVGRRVLYICPNSLLKNVMSEYRMWAPHRNATFIGGMTKAERQFVFDTVLPSRPDFVLVCNFEAWRKDKSLIDQLIKLDIDTVIIDEAHNAKDIKSIAYRGIKRLIDEGNPEYVIPMTGTPILNRPQELFALLSMVLPQEFYDMNDFLYAFCEQDKDTAIWKFQPGGLERVAKRISKNFLRRTKEMAGIDLPKKTVIEHLVDVEPATYQDQARVREQMRKYATVMIDEAAGKAIAATAVIAMFTRLRQIETWPAGIIMRDPLTKEITLQVDVEESQKIDYIIRQDPITKEWDGLIPETIEDERIVLFSQFKAPLREIQRRVQAMGKSACIMDGDTSPNLKDEIHRDFDARYTSNRDDSKYDIVLCNYRVGGVGLNLTAATQLIVLDEEWNPGKRDQAYDRIHRIGQENPVTIHLIRMKGTIDDWLAGIMEAKEGLVDGFNSAMVDIAEFKKFLDDSGLT